MGAAICEMDVYRCLGHGLPVYVSPGWKLPKIFVRQPYKIRVRLKCHYGKDGHALNSVHCPVHGYDLINRMVGS